MPKAGYAAVTLLAALALASMPAAKEPPSDALSPPEAPPPVAQPVSLPVEATLPTPAELELIDVPNDGGNQFAALWRWSDAAGEDISVALEVQATTDLLDKYEPTEAERNRLRSARERLAASLAPLLTDRDRLAEESAVALDKLTTLQNQPAEQRDLAAIETARAERWRIAGELSAIERRVDKARDTFAQHTHYWSPARMGIVDVAEKSRQYEWLAEAINRNEYLATNGRTAPGEALPTKGDFPDVFGPDAPEADKLLLKADGLAVRNPAPLAEAHDEYDETPPPGLTIPLEPGRTYVARLAVSDGTTIRYHDLGAVKPEVDLFKTTILNNFVLAWSFALIILIAVLMARKNPNLFIRRIAGLEAVDEAIGRATEMGKPVLYLTGMDTLSELSTLAAINILGRVARKVAEYDSDLIVPNRDPVVMTVAQEVVRNGYMDVGRPDAFKEHNIFFVTQDQFSYTATTCGIMLREKPAANFFMGYYYAESLLLAETGQRTGAIQIAGTDSQNQLPFFITTCDYTLIGEELYAASAYLSREPLLLGSLKGLDAAKGVIILAIVLQVLLFIIGGPELDFIRKFLQPL